MQQDVVLLPQSMHSLAVYGNDFVMSYSWVPQAHLAQGLNYLFDKYFLDFIRSTVSMRSLFTE